MVSTALGPGCVRRAKSGSCTLSDGRLSLSRFPELRHEIGHEEPKQRRLWVCTPREYERLDSLFSGAASVRANKLDYLPMMTLPPEAITVTALLNTSRVFDHNIRFSPASCATHEEARNHGQNSQAERFSLSSTYRANLLLRLVSCAAQLRIIWSAKVLSKGSFAQPAIVGGP